MQQTLRKAERLTGKKLIEELFKKGKSFQTDFLRIIFLETELPTKFPAQVLFSVPKKNFKIAVQRNRIKRKMREAYRKNKFIIYEPLRESKKKIALIFICNSNQESEYREIQNKIILSLQRLKTMVIQYNNR